MAAEAELERVVVPRLSGQDGGQPLNELPTQPVTITSSARRDVVINVTSATAASTRRLAGGDKFFSLIELANCMVALLLNNTRLLILTTAVIFAQATTGVKPRICTGRRGIESCEPNPVHPVSASLFPATG
jgi:hypothetical protein